MNKLEKQLDEAYDDLDEVETMFDYVTQDNRLSIDYCLEKRNIVCDRIKAIKQEIELDKQYKKLTNQEAKTNTMALFFLSNVDMVHKIDKILYKKETAGVSPNGFKGF